MKIYKIIDFPAPQDLPKTAHLIRNYLNWQGLEKAQSAASAAQDETKRQAIMYERSIKKLHQEIELAKADEEQRQRGIVKVRNIVSYLVSMSAQKYLTSDRCTLGQKFSNMLSFRISPEIACKEVLSWSVRKVCFRKFPISSILKWSDDATSISIL